MSVEHCGSNLPKETFNKTPVFPSLTFSELIPSSAATKKCEGAGCGRGIQIHLTNTRTAWAVKK